MDINLQKTNWKFILIVVFLSLFAVGGTVIYTRDTIREMVSLSQFPEVKKPEEEGEKVLREIINWTDITSNVEFREYFEEIIKANLGLEGIKKFTKEITKPIKGRELTYPSPPKNKDEPEWIFSPDGTKSVSIFAYFGEPDSSLDIYNRRNDEKVERLQDCGTPCSYWIVLWLNDEQFIFVQRINYERDYPLTLKHGPYVLNIILYDLAEDKEISYTSQEVEEYPTRPSWSKWDERWKKVCAKLYGEEYCQTTPK